MGLKETKIKEYYRKLFARNLVHHTRLRPMPHIVDASGVLHTWIMACTTVPEARDLARAFPMHLRRRFPNASAFYITTDAAVPPNKGEERAVRKQKTEYEMRRKQLRPTEILTDPDDLPPTLRTPAIVQSLQQGPLTVEEILSRHATDEDVMTQVHGGAWDRVLVGFASRKLVREGIQACDAVNYTIVDDPVLSPEGEVGAISFFCGSSFENAVIVGNDTDILVACLLQLGRERNLYYHDITEFRRKGNLYDISATLRPMDRDARDRLALLGLFLGCDYVHWNRSDKEVEAPTACRMYEKLSGTARSTMDDAVRYLLNGLDWRVDEARRKVVFDKFRGSEVRLRRATWAMYYYRGEINDITRYGWNADGTPNES